VFLSITALLGSAKIAHALLLRVIFFQKSFAQGLFTIKYGARSMIFMPQDCSAPLPNQAEM
jgi:hypothetical protein